MSEERVILGETLLFAPDGSVSAHSRSGLIPIQVSMAVEGGEISEKNHTESAMFIGFPESTTRFPKPCSLGAGEW